MKNNIPQGKRKEPAGFIHSDIMKVQWFRVLTAHEIVDDRVDGAVCIAQPMGQQRDGHHCVRTRNVHGVSV